MTDQVTTAIEQIRELSPKLNAATDEAAETIRLVNEFLAEASIGLPCEIVAESNAVDEDEDEDNGGGGRAFVYTSLAYDRLFGEYRILVRIERVTDGAGLPNYGKILSEQDWQSCPRDLKLKTFEKLPELLEKIAEKAKESIEATSATAATVRKITAAIKG